MTKTNNKKLDKQQEILAAAKAQFLSQGFAGASISQIAKHANVTKSLIFHHFLNKTGLWQAVKKSCISHLSSEDLDCPQAPASLLAFLEWVIMHRFEVYKNNEDLAKLVIWQSLESEPASLRGIDDFQPDAWEVPVQYLQQQGLVCAQYSPGLICTMIYGAISNVFFDHSRKIYEDEQSLESYKNLLIEGLTKALTPTC